MSEAGALLDELERAGLAVTTEEGSLVVSPASKLTPDLRRRVAKCSHEIVAVLQGKGEAEKKEQGVAAPRDWLVESWCTYRPLLEHTVREIEHAVRVGHQPGEPPPLSPGEPVPGCTCPECGGPTMKRRRTGGNSDWTAQVRAARSVPILDVAARLGCGEPVRSGQESRVLCPLHEDTQPSLRLWEDEDVWYCDVCAVGGDGIDLVRRALRLGFVGAVKWLTD